MKFKLSEKTKRAIRTSVAIVGTLVTAFVAMKVAFKLVDYISLKINEALKGVSLEGEENNDTDEIVVEDESENDEAISMEDLERMCARVD